MKNITVLILSIFFLPSVFGQAKNDQALKEAKRIFQVYTSTLLDINKDKNNKKAIAEFGKLFESGDVFVPNDFDTVKPTYITIRNYLPLIRQEDSLTSISFTFKKVSTLKENLQRNYDEISLDFLKTTTRKSVSRDSNGVAIDSSLSNKAEHKTMLIRLDENMAGNLMGRIVSISMMGQEPQLTSLHKEIEWWTSLSPEWKKIFTEKNVLKKYPNVKEIENLSFIFDLDLSNSKITDIKPLSKIKELRKLKLANTQIEDITPLDSCRILGELDISGSKVREFATLSKLKSLRKLLINNLEIKEIGMIADLTKLIELEASDNQINDITPVAKLENLEKLNLSVNKIFKIDAVKGLIKLTDLRLGKNQIESIEAVSPLVDLIRLDLFNNKITNLSPIRNHRKIAFLYIDFNPIKDLSPISQYGYLTHLSMAHTQVTDLSPISRSTTMSYLDISGSEVASLNPVDKFNVIKEFKMFNTKITKSDAAKYAKNHPGCRITYY